MDDKDTYKNLDVASFSFHHNFAEGSSLLNSNGGLPDSSCTVISPAETPQLSNFESKNNEPEISIFGAEKYFSSKGFEKNSFNYVHEKESAGGQDQSVRNFLPNTPKICSEASSWNSPYLLLKRPSRNFSQKKYKSGVGMRFYPGFCCKVPCLENKAVNINVSANPGELHGIHPSQPGSRIVDQFSFPVLTSGIKNLKGTKLRKEKIAPQEDSMNSIEVFVSEQTKVEDIALTLERKPSVVTWDAIPKTRNIEPTPFGSSALYDDTASYDSSDLFEIDNISLTRSPMLSSPESYAPSMTINNGNFLEGSAPHESSIVSAADLLSIFSDHVHKKDVSSADMIFPYETMKPKDSCSKVVPKSGPSWLLGCKSYKAVKIAENSHRTSDKGT